MKKIVSILLVVGTFVYASSETEQVETTSSTQEWRFGAEVYLWGASIKGTSGTGTHLNVHFKDIINNVNMSGMGAFVARHGRWSLLADLIYLHADKNDLNIPVGPLKLQSLGVKSWIAQPMVSYVLYESDIDRFDIMVGTRYISTEVSVGLNIAKFSPSDNAWDGVVGVRGFHNFTDKWRGIYHLDIGTGDSDFTWQGMAGLSYDFGDYAIHAGYRYIDWDHSSDVVNDLNIGGLFAGVRFRF